jgi:hypothetical protein
MPRKPPELRHATITGLQQWCHAVALYPPHGVLAWIVLVAALVAMVARWIASAPLFATLGVCFGNWADESRGLGRRSS